MLTTTVSGTATTMITDRHRIPTTTRTTARAGIRPLPLAVTTIPHGHDHPHGRDHPRGLKGLVLSVFAPHSHDSADSVDSALEASAQGIRAVKVSLVALGVTAMLQLFVVAISGSVALLADTIHNFSDALTAVGEGVRRGFMWRGFGKRRDKPAWRRRWKSSTSKG